MEVITSPNPYYIPGYTGCCPQYKYRFGDTYGTTTHKVLLDPTVHHAEELVLSNRLGDETSLRPAFRDIDMVNDRQGDTIYRHPMVPGYEGFVPGEHAEFGHTYTVQATEAFSDFERHQFQDKEAVNQLTKIGYLQNNKWDPKTLEDKQLTQSEFKLPLIEVRPECGALLRNMPVVEAPLTPPIHSTSPYFSDNADLEKYLKSGFTGHVPFSHAAFGKTNEAMTNSGLCDFTSNYRKRLSNEWAPVELDRPNPPILVDPLELYHNYVGQLPNYGGHIPGAKFRYGHTYGSDSRDAKRWLRGDYHN